MGNHYGPSYIDDTCEHCGSRLRRDADEVCEECGGEQPGMADCDVCDGTGEVTYCETCRDLEAVIADSD